ncbi:glycosyltransferase family 2 protein [Scatolibacter rhodanostii]|uniref:glycosyltransferase family 2 protein n=1 Tax=Scatolibacter rhodanostii TaxID=2014781 RepID=UPI000C080360|nr:glycosyltransferase family 2 protein [Scatolibacter rhodanostii]
MKPILSIIVPIYNAEKYIEVFAESVLNNNHDNLELLLINDGSTDCSLEIMNRLAQKDSRVKIHTIKNSGPANARNIGIEKSLGKYIMFLDSDDTLVQETFMWSLNYIEETEIDFMIFAFQIINVNGSRDFYYGHKDAIIDKGNFKQHFSTLYKENLLNQVWGKIYSAKIIKDNNIKFLDYKYGEDRLFVLETIGKCESIEISDRCLYYYYVRPEASLVTKFYDKKLEVCNLIDTKIHQLQNSYGDFSSKELAEINYMYLKSILSCETNLFLSSCTYSFAKKISELKLILTHSQVVDALKRSEKYGFVMDLSLSIIKSKNVILNYLLAKIIVKSSNLMPTFFIKVKHPQAREINTESTKEYELE